MAMKVTAAILSASMLSSAYAEADTMWRGQWTPYVSEGICRIAEWYIDTSGLNFDYWVDFLSLSYWPKEYEQDSVWAIADRWSIRPSEIFFILSGPGTNNEYLGEVKNYPVSVSVAGFTAKKIDLPAGSDGHYERTAFLLKEPESTLLIEKISKGEVVNFELLLADDSKRSFQLSSKDGAFFDVIIAQFKACIEVMPSNKSLKRTP
jgi:hypothetical protein